MKRNLVDAVAGRAPRALSGLGVLMTLFTRWTLLFSRDGRDGFGVPEPGTSEPSLD